MRGEMAHPVFIRLLPVCPLISQQNLNGIKSEKSEFQTGFEPKTLRDLAECSNHRATEHSMVSKGEMWVSD